MALAAKQAKAAEAARLKAEAEVAAKAKEEAEAAAKAKAKEEEEAAKATAKEEEEAAKAKEDEEAAKAHATTISEHVAAAPSTQADTESVPKPAGETTPAEGEIANKDANTNLKSKSESTLDGVVASIAVVPGQPTEVSEEGEEEGGDTAKGETESSSAAASNAEPETQSDNHADCAEPVGEPATRTSSSSGWPSDSSGSSEDTDADVYDGWGSQDEEGGKIPTGGDGGVSKLGEDGKEEPNEDQQETQTQEASP